MPRDGERVDTRATSTAYENSNVAAETVISIGRTEFVVVNYRNQDELAVFQRKRGETHPHKQIAPVERRVPFPTGGTFDATFYDEDDA